ncbi:hypothetical protein J2X77_003115 [Sphingobacterium sp. 2149]|nr:hypothetical protein [Sphingobacterium sp. 2149]
MAGVSAGAEKPTMPLLQMLSGNQINIAHEQTYSNTPTT